MSPTDSPAEVRVNLNDRQQFSLAEADIIATELCQMVRAGILMHVHDPDPQVWAYDILQPAAVFGWTREHLFPTPAMAEVQTLP
ncbi:MAG: hypothetical protein HY092_03665 [Candidatus Kerfeldbacteria bacterium]|nr:hypothetical protein [Candidatus Kerfeldbacteria bacterium]